MAEGILVVLDLEVDSWKMGSPAVEWHESLLVLVEMCNAQVVVHVGGSSAGLVDESSPAAVGHSTQPVDSLLVVDTPLLVDSQQVLQARVAEAMFSCGSAARWLV